MQFTVAPKQVNATQPHFPARLLRHITPPAARRLRRLTLARLVRRLTLAKLLWHLTLAKLLIYSTPVPQSHQLSYSGT